MMCVPFLPLEKKNLHQVQLKHPRAPGALGSETAYSPCETLDLSQVASFCAPLLALIFEILGKDI